MKPSVKNRLQGLGLIGIGLAIGGAGVFIGEYDDAPGAALLGIVLMVVAVTFGVRIARRKVEDP